MTEYKPINLNGWGKMVDYNILPTVRHILQLADGIMTFIP